MAKTIKEYILKADTTRKISLRVPERLLAEAQKKAKKEGYTLTDIILAGLARYLAE